MSNLSTRKASASDVIAHDVEPLEVHTDARAYSRAGWIIVLLGVVGFGLWASFAPLDKGVPLSGTVATESNRKTIQHQNGGTIKEILVKDGDLVKTGQVLVRMNSIVANSAVEMTRAQYFTARAAEARLVAERDGLSGLVFPAALEPYKSDPRVAEAIGLQRQLFASRRASLQSEVGAVEENIAGLKAQIQGVSESRDGKKIQLGILKEQLESMRDLAKDGYVTRSRLLDLERTYAQVNGALSEDIGNIGRSQRQVMEMTLRRLQRTQDFQKEVRTLLTDAQREADALGSRLEGQDYDLASADVKSPVDGTVVGLAVFTNGGVVPPGAHMMSVVPSGDGLVIEGQLAVNLIDKVHTGLPVEVNFSAFNANKTPHIPAVVTQVSADRTVEERTGNPYYKVRVTVTPEGAKLIASKKLDIRSGMPADLFVKTGERTMASYLLKPIVDRAKNSLTED